MQRIVVWIASLRLTAALLLLLGVVLILQAQALLTLEWPRVALLLALGSNLLATLWLRWKSFCRKPGLLGFHIALISLSAVAGVGRLFHQEAAFRIIEGQRRSLASTVQSKGIFAPAWLERAQVFLDTYEVRYQRATQVAARATLRVSERSGALRRIIVEPGAAVSVGGVRYNVFPDAGFAAVFDLLAPDGHRSRGAITFPAYRRAPEAQVQALRLPGVTGLLGAELKLPELRREREAWSLNAGPEARVALILPGETSTREISVGGSLHLPQGVLTLVGLPRYARIAAPYDPVWPIVVGLMASLPFFLLWHYLWTMRTKTRSAFSGPTT